MFLLTLRLGHSSEIQGIFELDFQFIKWTGQSTNFFKKKGLRNQMLRLDRISKINCSKKNECAKDQSTFCRSYVFMEKFKPAQNKKFTEAASDM